MGFMLENIFADIDKCKEKLLETNDEKELKFWQSYKDLCEQALDFVEIN